MRVFHSHCLKKACYLTPRTNVITKDLILKRVVRINSHLQHPRNDMNFAAFVSNCGSYRNPRPFK